MTDPRCPYCGRPVLGTFVSGYGGRYHPECCTFPPSLTRPPARFHAPPFPDLPPHREGTTCSARAPEELG